MRSALPAAGQSAIDGTIASAMPWSWPRSPRRSCCCWRRSSWSRTCAGFSDLHPGFSRMASSRRACRFRRRIDRPRTWRVSTSVVGSARRAPGVKQVGVISVAPLSGLLATVPFSVAGQLDCGTRPAQRQSPRDLARLSVSGRHAFAAWTVVLGDRSDRTRRAWRWSARRSPIDSCPEALWDNGS